MQTIFVLISALTMLIRPVSEKPQEPEITVYKTYEDFNQKKGQDYDTYHSANSLGAKVTLVFIHKGDKVKVKCGDIWGFRYRDALYRTDTNYEMPVKLISFGRLCYYENGPAHLAMMKNGTNSAEFGIGAFCYASVDLRSEIFQFSGKKSDGKKAREHFVAVDPIYAEYFDCLGFPGNNVPASHRKCVEQFQAAHPLK